MSVADADIRNLNHETPVNVITMRSAMPAILALAAASTSVGAAVWAPSSLLRVGRRAADDGSPVGPAAASMEGVGLRRDALRDFAAPPSAESASADGGGGGGGIIPKKKFFAGQDSDQQEGSPSRMVEPPAQGGVVAVGAAASAAAAAERSASADGDRRGSKARIERKLAYVIQSNAELQTAVSLYCSDEAAAEATYGSISTWNTGQVTSMDSLFKEHCSTKSTFNADISLWDGKCGGAAENNVCLFVSHHQLTSRLTYL